MAFFNAYAVAILQHVFKMSNLTAITNLYVGLSTTTPADDGTNITEPSGNAYARVSTAASDWNTPTSANPSVVTNATTITFPEATGAWGTVTHAVLYSASSGGTKIGVAALTQSQAVVSGNTPKYNPGDFTFTLH